MPHGVMGGHFQPMGHSFLPTLEYGLDIQEALDLPAVPLRGRCRSNAAFRARSAKRGKAGP
jgi:hypothetical protein